MSLQNRPALNKQSGIEQHKFISYRFILKAIPVAICRPHQPDVVV